MDLSIGAPGLFVMSYMGSPNSYILGIQRPRSFERRRPADTVGPLPPRGDRRRRPTLPRNERFRGAGPQSPLFDPASPWPQAPELSSSPTTTTSFSQSSSSSSSITHWVPKVFEQSRPNTPFITSGPAYVHLLLRESFPNQ